MKITKTEFIKIFNAWADIINENRDYLIKLDGIAGDGDLGLSMTDGFNAVREVIQTGDEEDIGILLYSAGKTMSAYAPSSLGTLIAFGFMEAGKAFKGRTEITGLEIAILLETFQDGIIKRGKAKVGEKTFIDGFNPAVQIMKNNSSEEKVQNALREAVIASENGATGTIGMLAKYGRIAVRGEDSRQILDPGAVVGSLLVKALSDTLNDDII